VVGLIGILAVGREHKLVIRGATSALGQAAVNIAAQVGAHIIATTRDDQRATMLRSLGAQEVVPETSFLSDLLRARHGQGLDAVLDIIGTSTVLDSLAMLRRGGRVCLVGFLGGGGQIGIDPIFQIPSGRHLSAFASALVIGTPEFPVSDIPFQAIIERVAKRTYKAKPARIFRFEEIQEAHRIMEANEAGGKIVVCL
jgi:NADPH:quinone reductase